MAKKKTSTRKPVSSRKPAPKLRKTSASARVNKPKAAARRTSPKRARAGRKQARLNARFVAFLDRHPTPYTALIGTSKQLPAGKSLSQLVRGLLQAKCSDPWETTAHAENGAKMVFIAFASKSDFSALKTHFKGQPWRSIFSSSVGGFSAILT